MSENWVSKQDLHDFYMKILPFLGSVSVDVQGGFTPVGTIIPFMGVTAPQNYLACNGQTVNIEDYPMLAAFFADQFGAANYFGGDGTTTFGVPDLRGEFLRGAGTNGHTNQGNGATVGAHQDGTTLQNSIVYEGQKMLFMNSSDDTIQNLNVDSSVHWTRNYHVNVSGSKTTFSNNDPVQITTRPTNTSVLYCIAVKNIYIEQEGGTPSGGVAGEILGKTSSKDFDMDWCYPTVTRFGTAIVIQNVHVTSTETVVNIPQSGQDVLNSLTRGCYFIAMFGSGNNSLVQQLAWLMNGETTTGSGRRWAQKIFLGTHWVQMALSTDNSKLYLVSDSTATNIDELYFRELRIPIVAWNNI